MSISDYYRRMEQTATQVIGTPGQGTLSWGLYYGSAGAVNLITYGILTILGLILFRARNKGHGLPELNPKKSWEFTNLTRGRVFMRNSMDLLTKGRSLFPASPYELFCDWGQLTMLPVESVEDIRSDKRFDFSESSSDDSHAYVPGFDSLMNDLILPKVVTRYLTKALTKVTGPLSEEAALVIQQTLTESPGWHAVNLQEDIMTIVSRMSSRVFMGEELCRDEQWNKASANYTLKLFAAADVLREYPRWTRPFVHWFLPCCWEVRKALQATREHLQPHVERREKIKAEALARGQQSPFDDSIEWFAQAGSKRPPADCQVTLSLVAIHTTTDLLASAMINIAKHPELFQPLREEVVRVLSAEGLKKTALYDLKLMDSVFKETQRLKPINLAWKRMALEDVVLPNGMTVKRGSKVAIDLTHMWSDQYYNNAKTFDGYRFLRLRETPGQDHMAHLVSTGQNHLGFGHGVHACPGRFFASNEVKIALCHLILKYDWKLPEGSVYVPVAHGMAYSLNPAAKLIMRRRTKELDLSAIAVH